MKTVAVSGASGFIGRHVSIALARSGVHVKALGRGGASFPRHDNIQPAICDITNEESLAGVFSGVDALVHSAALVGGASASEARVRDVNVTGTRNILREAARLPSLRRVVHLSSVAVMGVMDPGPPICETDVPRPRSIYGRSKLESETEVRMARGDFDRVILRPMWVYGRDSLSTRKLIRNIARRRMFLVGSGGNRIQPVHIDDMVLAILAALRREEAGGDTLQIAGPAAMTTREMCNEIARAVNAPAPKVLVPVWFARAAASILEAICAGSGRKLPIDHDKIDFFQVHHEYSIERARAVLGWNPAVEFRQGIAQAAEGFGL